MKNKLLKATLSFIGLSLIFLLHPFAVNAFLSPSTLNLVASSAMPFVIGLLITIITQLIILFKKIKKSLKLILTILSFILLVVLLYLLHKRILELKQINTLTQEEINLSETDLRMQQFLLQAKQDSLSSQNAVIGALDQPLKQAFQDLVGKADIETAINDGSYKLLDIHCLPTPIINSIPACDLTWKIYSNYDNAEAIENIMASLGISKSDKLIAYCDAGYSSPIVAYILSQRGYDIKYASLLDIKDYSLLNPNFKVANLSPISIDTYSYSKSDQYLYFLINDSDQLIFRYENLYNELIKNTTLIKTNQEYDIRELRQDNLQHLVIELDEFDLKKINNYKIICQDKFHCFLTRHFINFIGLTKVDKLYCLDCTRKRLSHE